VFEWALVYIRYYLSGGMRSSVTSSGAVRSASIGIDASVRIPLRAWVFPLSVSAAAQANLHALATAVAAGVKRVINKRRDTYMLRSIG
jgi:hypothetical protein